MGFRRAKSTQGNSNCQKIFFENDQVPGHHPRALRIAQQELNPDRGALLAEMMNTELSRSKRK